MVDWQGKASAAQAKIAEVGAPVTLLRGSPAYDPDTDTTTKGVTETIAGHGVFKDQMITDDSGRQVVATTVTLNRAPKAGDTLATIEREYRVTKTLTIAPGGVPLLWSAVLET